MYVLNKFLTADCSCTTKYFWKNHIEFYRPHLYTSFGTFYVQIDKLFATQWVFKQLEEFQNQRYFPSMRAICWFSNILQRLTVPRIMTNLGAKGAKSSVDIWTISFYTSFFKNILWYMSSWLSKIHSVHIYVMPRRVYFGWFCKILFNWYEDSMNILKPFNMLMSKLWKYP